MRPEQTTLVLAGSREAHGIVDALVARRRQVIASLSEPERTFGRFAVPTRVGHFVDKAELESWLREKHVSTVIDASHAFDRETSHLVAGACTRMALRYLRVIRPPWKKTPLDRWQHVTSIKEAIRHVPEDGRVFTNTGWLTLPEYADFPGRKLFFRQTHDAVKPAPFPFVEFVEGQPPFSQFQEQYLFEQLGITHLLCRNVGGAASMSKLLAARAMQLPVFMIAREALPGHISSVETVVEALAWEANV